MANKDVEIIEKTICFQGFFRIERYRLRHHLFSGKWSQPIVRELFERGHAAAVLPYDPIRDEVILIEQFRIGAMNAPGGPWLLEIVAGIIEDNEQAEDVVKRKQKKGQVQHSYIAPLSRFSLVTFLFVEL